jgi:HAMP domain-containing protein
MTIRKDKLEEPKWAKSMAFLKQRNNWADQPDVVLAKNTLDDQALFAVGASIDSVPETGRNLGLLETGNTVYSRGLFPLHDASGGRVGLLVVLHDVTQVYREMKSTMRLAGLTIAVLTILLSLALIMVIERLVFRRLDQITRTAKRVVGGDYTTAIVPSSQDEIGSFEALFDQFRVVFVNLVQEVEARNKSDGEGSAASRQPDDRSGK